MTTPTRQFFQFCQFFIFVILFLTVLQVNAQVKRDTFYTSGTFTVPVTVTDITIEVWGGGGSGGPTGGGKRGGGGGGGYARGTKSVMPGDMFSYIVGAGGLAGDPANNGANSSFNSGEVEASGGEAGTDAAGGTGGAFIAGSTGFSGGNGAFTASGNGGGGGGGSAFSNANGNSGSGSTGGTGAGNGGNGASANNNPGFPGSVPGGGGGGKSGPGGPNEDSGNGADGMIIISYECEVPIFTVCPDDFSIATDPGLCEADVTYTIDYTPANAVISYEFSGATIDSGSGSGSGSAFAVGTTLVRIFAETACDIDTCEFEVTVVDTEMPDITCPDMVDIACDDERNPEINMVLGIATATDNCDDAMNITIIYTDVLIAGACPQDSVLTRTWRATDMAGNSITCTQVINIEDNEAPVAVWPADVIVYADAMCLYVASPIITGEPTSITDCDPNPNVSPSDFVNVGPCGLDLIERTWTITDACNNATNHLQIITVADTTSPVLMGCPVDITVQCDNIPDIGATVVTATDNCTPMLSVTDDEITQDDPNFPNFCAHYYQIVRTWSVEDACGNTASCQQIVSVRDTTNPDIDCPADETVECDDDTSPASLGEPMVSDNCTIPFDPLFISYDDVTIPSACIDSFTITRTWTAIDECNNEATCNQIITVQDTQDPTIDCPADAVIECDEDDSPINLGEATGSDNCDVDVLITSTQMITPGSCPNTHTISRTWRATDNCGNTAECVQTIEVADTTPPDVTCSDDVTVECNNIPTANTPPAIDNCSPVDVNYSEDLSGLNGCNNTGIIVRTWVFRDSCNNLTPCVQTITVEDSTPPTWDQLMPANTTVNCQSVPAVPGGLTYSDNCGADNQIPLFDELSTQGADPLQCDYYTYTITRTWTAEDECGNETVHTQTIQVQDVTMPNFTAPANILAADTLTCGDENDLSLTGFPTVITDNCLPDEPDGSDGYTIGAMNWTTTNGYTISFTSSLTNPQPWAECSLSGNGLHNRKYQVSRIWTVEDACGNSVTALQTITIIDDTPPVFDDCPAAITVECDEVPGIPTMTATDNCDDPFEIDITYDTLVTNVICPGSYTITRTWTAMDICDNETTCIQVITITDTEAPVLTGMLPGGASGNFCFLNATPAPDVNTIAAAYTDNCNNVTAILIDSEITGDDCSWTATYTYTIEDECDNFAANAIVVFTGGDTEPPMLTGVLPGGDVGNLCIANAPLAPDVAAIESEYTDNCGNVTAVLIDEDVSGDDCSWTATYSYTIVDECGNFAANAVVVFTGGDTGNPSFTPPGNIIASNQLTCGDEYNLSLTGFPTDLQDNCLAPQANGSDGYTLGDVSWQTSNGYTVSFTSALTNPQPWAECSLSGNGLHNRKYQVSRIWTVEDACGNSVTALQTITIIDDTPPVFDDCPAAITVECDEVPGIPTMTATDNCDDPFEIDITYDTLVTNVICPGSYTITRTWTAFDICDNSDSCTQLITVVDTEVPELTGVLPGGDVGNICLADAPTAPLEIDIAAQYTDNCGVVTATLEDTVEDGDDCAWTVTYTYEVYDECGNLFEVDIVYTGGDDEAPELTGMLPGGALGNVCIAAAPGAVPLATIEAAYTDNCGNVTAELIDEDVMGDDCSWIATFTYSIKDDCDNFAANAVVVFTGGDTGNPSFTPPGNIIASNQLTCGDENNLSLTGFPTNLQDNCLAPQANGSDGYTLGDVSWQTSNGYTVSFTSALTNPQPWAECSISGNGLHNRKYQISRIWTVEDACGNSVTALQTITIIDDTPPVFDDCPAAITVECDEVPGIPTMTATDNCDDPFEIDITYDTLVTNVICTGSYTITRTWTAFDICDNSDSCTQTIVVIDTNAPNWDDPMPDDDTVECDDIPTAPVFTASDACTDVTVSYGEVSSQGMDNTNCDFTNYTLTRTWTAIDACGNARTHTQAITVEDTTAPVLDNCDPDDLNETIECVGAAANESEIDSWNAANITNLEGCASDNCGAVSVTSDYNFNNYNQGCGATGSITVTYTISDPCGNESTIEGTFTIEDTTNPVLSGCPGDVTISCEDQVPSAANVTVDDVCDPNATVDLDEVSTQTNDGSCSDHTYAITRTWTGEDACGNTASCFHVIYVEDENIPEITLVGDVSINLCVGDTYDDAGATAEDPCFGDITADIVVNNPVDVNVAGTYVITYNVSDPCGNAALEVTRTVTVHGHPLLETSINGVIVTSNNDGMDDIAPDIEVCNESNNIMINYFTDLNSIPGNVKAYQIFDVSNVTVPFCNNCSAALGAFAGANGTASLIDPTMDGTLKLRFRAWLDWDNDGVIDAEECAGDWVEYNFIIKAELVLNCPEDVTEPACQDQATIDQAFADWLATFNFTGGKNPIASNDNIGAPLACGGTTTVTWTVTSDCEPDRTCSATFTVTEDDEDPDLSGCDQDELNMTFECDGAANNEAAADQWNADNIAYLEGCATDNCGDFTVTSDYDFTNLSDACGETGTLVVSYTVTDQCGNAAVTSGIFTVIDTTDPDLTNCDPSDLNDTHECDGAAGNEAAADIWNTNNIAYLSSCASDLCGDITVSSDYDYTNLSLSCGYAGTLTVTYTVEDECGNESQITGIFTIIDTTDPDISSCNPADLNATYECSGASANEMAVAAWDADNIAYLYNCAADVCGDVTVYSNYDFSNYKPGCGFTGSMEVTYTIRDECGNESTIDGIFTIIDTTDPDIVDCEPTDLDETLECDGAVNNAVAAANWNADNISYLESCASDLCGNIEVTSDFDFSNLVSSCGDAGTLTVTYTVTDECNNAVQIMGTLTIEDTTDPDLSACDPSDLSDTYECAGAAANEAAAALWNAANILYLESCATDNCGSVTVTSDYDYANLSGLCGTTGSLLVFYTVTDACNNTSMTSGTFTIIDNTAPDLTGCNPDLLNDTHECDGPMGNEAAAVVWNNANIAYLETCVSELCSDITVSFSSSGLNPDCGITGTVTVTYTVRDDCNNSSQITGTFTIVDTTDPEWDQVMPEDVTIECDAIPDPPEVITASDDCDAEVDVVFDESQMAGNCDDNYTITRIWTATDDCGNSIIHTQVISVQDTTDPTWDQPMPANVTVECDAVPDAPEVVTATDNCDSEVEVTYDEERTDGPCGNTYTLTRTWVATDNCGNATTHIQTISVQDTTDPTWDQPMPVDVTVECNSVPDPPEVVTATDNCDENVDVTYDEERTDGPCEDTYTLTRTWVATDNCGNAISHTQTIEVQDTSAPDWDDPMPQDITVECDAVPLPPAIVKASDNCDLSVDINYSEVRTDGNCEDNYTLTRTWVAADNCNNAIAHTQTITVEDTTLPTWDQAMPADITVECDDIPAVPAIAASDNCDDDVEVTYGQVRTDGNCLDNYTLTRTWVATDNCNNAITHIQTITVEDTTDPTWDQAMPSDVTVECDAVPVPPTPITASDNCDMDVSVTYDQERTDGNCLDNYLLTRTWVATDNCGNETIHTQEITVRDTQSPTWNQPMPPNITVECDAVPAPYGPVTSTDNCDPDPEVDFSELRTDGNCEDNYTLTRTWLTYDRCGNERVHTQVITVQDTTDPTWDQVMPADVTVECDAVPDAPEVVTASDNCDTEVEVTYDEERTDGPCEDTYTLTRTWVATDNCSNAITHIQTIQVQDTTDPTWDQVMPADVTVECDAIPDAPEVVTASDNCDTEVEVTYDEERTDGPCEDTYTLTRTWVATDNCGNAITHIQTISVQDTTDPTWDQVMPADVTVECDAVPDAPEVVTASDNCDDDVEVTYDEERTDGPCEDTYTLTRTWVATDNCSNAITHIQTIQVQDTTDPTWDQVMPADVTVECDAVPMVPTIEASDNCDADVEVTFDEERTDGPCEDTYTLTRTWVATDNCGNAITQIQTIQVQDTTDPTWDQSMPDDVTVECDAVPDPFSPVTASDNCDTDVEIGFTEERVDGSCEDTYTLIRTWTATDNCGNAISHVQTIEVEDTTPPVAICQDITIYLDINGEVTLDPEWMDNGSSDNCDADLTYSAQPDYFTCNEVGDNLVTLTVEDNCGWTDNCNAIVTVLDTVPPTALCKNHDLYLDANGQGSIMISDIDDGSWDACGIDYMELSRTTFNCSDLGDVLVTLEMWDVNGNYAFCTAFVSVIDSIPPKAFCKNATVQLNAQGQFNLFPFMIDNGSTDECGIGNATVSPNPMTCNNIGANLITLTVFDVAGNSASCVATVIVEDNDKPTMACKNITVTLNANGDPITIQPADIDNGTKDNCTIVSLTLSKTLFTCNDIGDNVVKLFAIDQSGNTGECAAIVKVVDNLPPFWTWLPGDVTVYCVENGAVEVPLADDNCGVAQVTLKSTTQEIWPAGPYNSYLVRRVWMAQDAAGNTIFYEQIVYVLPGGELFVNCNGDIVTPETNIPIKVYWPIPFVDDICFGKEDMYQIRGPEPGNYFNPGSKTIISYEYIDIYGTRHQCSFWVTVPNDSNDYALILNQQDCNNLMLEDCGVFNLPAPDNYSFEYVVINQLPIRFALESIGDLETFADGSAHLTGHWLNANGTCGWEMDIWFHRRRTHDGWKAAGGLINNLVFGADPTLWDFFEVDGTRSRMVGTGCYAGQEFNVRISPNFAKFGFQYGPGANTKTLANGGWVIIGIYNPMNESLIAQGIFSFEQTCQNLGSTLKDAAEVVSLSGFNYPVKWSNGVNGPKLGDVPAGQYSVTITDQNGKDSIAHFVLLLPTDCEPYFENQCRPRNVAPGSISKQLSTFMGASSSRAIDGNTDGDFANGSVSGTLNGFQNWWSVNLVLPKDVHKVRIWNRTDCCSDWLQPVWLFVSESPIPEFGEPDSIAQLPWITAFYHFGPIDTFVDFDFQGKAQYMKIQLDQHGRLNLAEVQVLVCQADTVGVRTDGLIQQDDEQVEESRVSPDVEQVPTVTTTPNPASDLLTLDLSQEEAYDMVVTIVNSAGMEVFMTKLPPQKQAKITMDVSQWMPGQYFVTVSTPVGVRSLPLTIQR